MAKSESGDGESAGGRSIGDDLNARERPTTKIERVRAIMELMASGEWITGVSGPRWAKAWGVSEVSIKADAGEASRNFRMDDDERADLKARWLANIQSATAHARQRNQCRAEASLLELQGKALGFFEPDKIEVSGSLSDLLQLAHASKGDGSGEGSGSPVGE